MTTKMEDYQKRVLKEREELGTRLDALADFISGSKLFPTLHEDEKDRLKRQLDSMQVYYTVLTERMDNF